MCYVKEALCLTMKQAISVSLSVCYSHISRAVHQIDFTLVCRFPAEDPSKCCGRDNGAISACNTFRINTFCICAQQWGVCGFSVLASWLCRLKLGSHLVPRAWVVQQLPVVTHCSEKNSKSSRVWMSGETGSTEVFFSSARTGSEIISFCQQEHAS